MTINKLKLRFSIHLAMVSIALSACGSHPNLSSTEDEIDSENLGEIDPAIEPSIDPATDPTNASPIEEQATQLDSAHALVISGALRDTLLGERAQPTGSGGYFMRPIELASLAAGTYSVIDADEEAPADSLKVVYRVGMNPWGDQSDVWDQSSLVFTGEMLPGDMTQIFADNITTGQLPGLTCPEPVLAPFPGESVFTTIKGTDKLIEKVWFCPNAGTQVCVEAGNLPGYVNCNNGAPDDDAVAKVCDRNCCCAPHTKKMGCFAESTRVRRADGKRVKVTEVKQGDRLWNPVTKAAVEVANVLRTTRAQSMVTLVTKRGESIRVTSAHPLRTARGDVAAGELVVGDLLTLPSGRWTRVKVMTVETAKDVTVVNFDLAVSSSDPREHQLEADGLIAGDFWLQRKLELSRAVAAH